MAASALLADTYQRLAASCEALNVRVAGPGPVPARPPERSQRLRRPEGWVDGAELAQSREVLDAFVDAEAVRVRERHRRTARVDAAASRALHDYVWSVSLLMSGAWYLERRVPWIRPQDVQVDLTSGAFEIVPRSDVACLAGDRAAAGRSGVRVLLHEEALRAELRAAVAEHMRPLLAAIGPHVRRGPRALWGMVADDLISGIWSLGRTLGQEERAVRSAAELLPGGIPPFPGGAGFRRLAGGDGRSYLTRTRIGCCLYYAIRPAEVCLTCPRVCDAERVRRLESEG
jgi:hypothetical protein